MADIKIPEELTKLEKNYINDLIEGSKKNSEKQTL